MIREAVTDYFQRAPNLDLAPDQVVALGAAIHASSVTTQDQPAFLLDVTPLSLRVGVAGGLAESIIASSVVVSGDFPERPLCK